MISPNNLRELSSFLYDFCIAISCREQYSREKFHMMFISCARTISGQQCFGDGLRASIGSCCQLFDAGAGTLLTHCILLLTESGSGPAG